MAFTAGWINFTTQIAARYTIVTAYSTAARVQCYVNDDLISNMVPDGTSVQFRVTPLKSGQYIRLLAVDLADADTNFFSQAWPLDEGNRITTRSPTEPGYFRDYIWSVYLDDVLIHERAVWPFPDSSSSKIGGRGSFRGVWRGYETYGSGRGNWRGLQRGYEPVELIFESTIQSPATYELATTITDKAGNESAQTETTITHDTYPDEPESLTVSSFVLGTGTITLAWTESDDI